MPENHFLAVSQKMNLIDGLLVILARELYLDFFLMEMSPGEAFRDIETGVLRRISIRI